jgi:hypothetical protein
MGDSVLGWNARRLATRVNVVLTVALAAAAAGTKVLGDTLSQHAPSGRAIFVAGAVLGVASIFIAFVRVLAKRHPTDRAVPASAHLLPAEDASDVADAQDEVRVLQRAFLSTTAAAYELHARNAEERKRLAEAQQWLIIGAALTLLSGAIYTWVRVPTAGLHEQPVQMGGQHGRR